MLAASRPRSCTESGILRITMHPPKAQRHQGWSSDPKAHSSACAAMKVKESEAKVTQSCLTLCRPMDYAVHGILQARILEWVAFPFSRGSSQPRLEPKSPAMQADSLPAELAGKQPWEQTIIGRPP